MFNFAMFNQQCQCHVTIYAIWLIIWSIVQTSSTIKFFPEFGSFVNTGVFLGSTLPKYILYVRNFACLQSLRVRWFSCRNTPVGKEGHGERCNRWLLSVMEVKSFGMLVFLVNSLLLSLSSAVPFNSPLLSLVHSLLS